MGKLNIVINIDDNYIQHAMAMLTSLYENNKSNQVILHVLHNNLSVGARKYLSDLTLRYHNDINYWHVDESRLYGVQFRKERPLSYAAYYRLLLAEILPADISKVLYLDCDIIVLQDLSEFIELELDNYPLAATLDNFPYSSQHRMQLHMPADQKTFCSGVMIVNLDYWRKNKVTEGLLEYAKRPKKIVYLHDQDVLNYYFKDRWFMLPPKWNRYATSNRALRCELYKSFDYEEYSLKPLLIHYAAVGVKPWFDCPSPCYEYYRKYLKLSGFEKTKYEKVDIKSFIRNYTQFLKVKLGLFRIKVFRKF